MERHYAYYQGLAICYAYVGDLDAAEEYLQEAIDLGCREEELWEIRAEMAVSAGDYVKALELYDKVNQNTKSIHALRRAGYLSLQAADATNDASRKQRYYAKAAQCYEQLRKDNYASYNDRINLATAYEGMEKGDSLETLLQGLTMDYPDRYEAYFRLGVWKYKEQIRNAPAKRDFSEVLDVMSRAESLYRKSGIKDEQFESFLNVLDGIR